MNKKQLIVAWVTGIIISLICLHPPTYRYHLQQRIDVVKAVLYIIPILIIGILLIFTLRNDDLIRQITKTFRRQMNIKKIIAREGLILVGITTFVILTFYLGRTMEKESLRLQLKCHGMVLVGEKHRYANSNYSAFIGAEGPRKSIYLVGKPFNEWTPEELNTMIRATRLQQWSDILTDFSWIIGLVFYLAYLLVRIILWERKTLKQRPA